MTRFDTIDDFSLLRKRFHEKFVILRRKVHRVLDRDPNTKLDDESYDVFVNSILVDCRALFIENSRYTKNCTIQNLYTATNHPEFAKSIDDIFDQKTVLAFPSEKPSKVGLIEMSSISILLMKNRSKNNLDNVLSVIDRSTIDNLFIDILLIARQYEEYREYLKKLSFAVIEAMTGGVDSDE